MLSATPRPRSRRLCRLAGALILVSLLACSPLRAWAPETRVRLVDEAVRLMPESLRLALEGHRKSLLRGMLDPARGEDGPEHRPESLGGSLERQIGIEAAALTEALAAGAGFEQLAERFGRVAHFVSDAGFPPGTAGSEGAARYGHFSAFCESRRERFPAVFYGHDSPELARGDLGAYAAAVLDRARADDSHLARAYAAAGDPPAPTAFDDRSVPFAVGSLAYSHTFTDIVRVWIAIWRQAGGDMGRTPYLKPAQ